MDRLCTYSVVKDYMESGGVEPQPLKRTGFTDRRILAVDTTLSVAILKNEESRTLLSEGPALI